MRDDRRIDKVFFLIDRKDLDDQTVDEYNSFEYGCRVDNTDSTATLVRALGDSSKTLVVTTIQKMAAALRNPKYEEKMAPLRDKRCVFIIDECHRSQFGKMHSSIQGHFQAANYIGSLRELPFLQKIGAQMGEQPQTSLMLGNWIPASTDT